MSSLHWATAEQRQNNTQTSHRPLVCDHSRTASPRQTAASCTWEHHPNPSLLPQCLFLLSWSFVLLWGCSMEQDWIPTEGTRHRLFLLFRPQQPVSQPFLRNPTWWFLVRYSDALTGSLYDGYQSLGNIRQWIKALQVFKVKSKEKEVSLRVRSLGTEAAQPMLHCPSKQSGQTDSIHKAISSDWFTVFHTKDLATFIKSQPQIGLHSDYLITGPFSTFLHTTWQPDISCPVLSCFLFLCMHITSSLRTETVSSSPYVPQTSSITTLI